MGKLLTVARDLRRRKAREREGLFVAEGVRAVEEVLRAQYPTVGALISPTLADAPRGRALRAALEQAGVPITDVTDREFASAADTESPQGVLLVARIPAPALPAVTATTRVLVLDALQDPGNVGTVLRTAAALGVAATIVLPGTVDPWNAKVVRAAVGAQCHHPVVSLELDACVQWLATAGVPLWGADHRGRRVGDSAQRPTGALALALGNEGAGLTDGVRAACAELVAIPIGSAVESLNVGVAAGILLWELRA